MIRCLVLVLCALLAGACSGGGGLSGKSKSKSGTPGESTKAKETATSSGSGTDSGSVTEDGENGESIEIEDAEDVKASEPVQVSGAFLTCGAEPAAQSLMAEEQAAFGCGFLDATGAKVPTQPTISSVAVAAADDEPEAATLQPAPAVSRYQVVFGVPEEYVGGEIVFSVAHEAAPGSTDVTTSATKIVAETKPCAAGKMRPKASRACEMIVTIYEYLKKESSETVGFAYAPDEGNYASVAIRNELDDGDFKKDDPFGKALVPRHCNKSYGCLATDSDKMRDGTIPIFLMKKKGDFKLAKGGDAKELEKNGWEQLDEMMRLFSEDNAPDGAYEVQVFSKGDKRQILKTTATKSGWDKGSKLGYVLSP